MSEVNNAEELKEALEKNEDEILIKNPKLSKAISHLKWMPAGAVVTIVVALASLPIGGPIVAGAATAGGGLWMGNHLARVLSILGFSLTKKLIYSYTRSADKEGNTLLKKKF